MGDRNHLHVCRHCGVVHATSSSTGPRACTVCEGFTFSEYEPDVSFRESPARERESPIRQRE